MDYYDTFSLYLEKGDHDPASDDETLAQKLRENQDLGKKKLDQVFQEYVEKQNAAKEAKENSLLEKEGNSQSADESSGGSDDEDDDSLDGKTIYDSDDSECSIVESELRDDAEPQSINVAEFSDISTDKEEMTENELSNKDHHASHESLAVEETVKKSQSLDTKQSTEIVTIELCTEEVAKYSNEGMDIDTSEVSEGNIGDDVASNNDMDTSNPSEEKNLDDVTEEKNVDEVASNNDVGTSKHSKEKDLDDAQIAKDKNVEKILLQSSVQQTETKDGATKVVGCDKTAGSSSTHAIASPKSPIQKATSTVATCKLNLVENSRLSVLKVADKSSHLIAATEVEGW